MHSISERARAYLATLPISVSGQGGHAAAFVAAVSLVRGFGLTEIEALPIIQEWNAACLPPWNEADLRRKLRSASTSSTRPFGYLLNDNEYRPARTLSDFENDNGRKSRDRKLWPVFKSLCMDAIEAIARLRKLPAIAVILAAKSGFLWGAMIDGHPCFVICEGTFAQARRIDGGPLKAHDGREVKAKNLLGAQGAFIGQRWLGGPSVRVLLVEGVIGLVEAIAAHELADPAEGWTVIAATSAYSRFDRDPELLALLAGRQLRIIPDGDEAGKDGAASWLTDAESVGCTVDAFKLPPGCKDLGPIVAEPKLYLETLTALFQ